jgi:hypothetical protein
MTNIPSAFQVHVESVLLPVTGENKVEAEDLCFMIMSSW